MYVCGGSKSNNVVIEILKNYVVLCLPIAPHLKKKKILGLTKFSMLPSLRIMWLWERETGMLLFS